MIMACSCRVVEQIMQHTRNRIKWVQASSRPSPKRKYVFPKSGLRISSNTERVPRRKARQSKSPHT